MSKTLVRILFALIGMVLIGVVGFISHASASCGYHAGAYQGLELNRLSQELEKTGLVGRIHGAAAPSQMFVMSVREPKNFFSHREFSLLATDQKIQKTLTSLNRHDEVCIQGQFIPNPSPQKHILIKSLKVLAPWSTEEVSGTQSRYQREATLPEEILSGNSLMGKVHAISEDGKVLVVEYRDTVIPLFVDSGEYTQGLYRGDIVQLAYRLQQKPERPTHLKLDLDTEQPLKVLDAIADWHGQEKVLTGHLVKFPRSPQLKFDVYAIEVETLGLKRTFTLVNFENIDEFQKIRDRLADIWDSHLTTAAPGRNMLINPEVMVEARGRVNLVSTEQANPQILVNQAEDLQVKLT